VIELVIWLIFIDELGMITMAKPRDRSNDKAGSPSLGGSERDDSIFLLNSPNQPALCYISQWPAEH
jgi:hypothetical protein